MNRILYIQYTNPCAYPPLEHSSRILAEAGWRVLFLGTGAAGANDLEFPPHRNIAVQRMAFCESGWKQKVHFVRFCLWVLWKILVFRPDWVYASDSLSCPAAAIITCLPRVCVLYHEHDSPDTDVKRSRFLEIIFRTRRWVAHHAEVCVLPNAKRLERFQDECGRLRSVEYVWNCPAKSEATPPRSAASIPIWLLYHGSIVPNRLPTTVLDALALLPDAVRLRVVGYETSGSRGYVAGLLRRARALDLQDRVEFLGSIPRRSDLLAITLRSDIGLALMPRNSSDRNCETMAGASNKAFDYLACGVPLIVSDLPDWRAIFVEPGFALVCDPDEPQSIASAINSLLKNPERMRAMGEAGRQKIIEAWNYETVFQPVMRRLSTPYDAEALHTQNRRLENVG